MSRGKNIVPRGKCDHGHVKPEIKLSDGWIQPVAPKNCKSPDCVYPTPSGLKFKKPEEDEVIKRIPQEPVPEFTYSPCKKDGCLLNVRSDEKTHVGLCLLFDFDKPKIEEDQNWCPPRKLPELPQGHFR